MGDCRKNSGNGVRVLLLSRRAVVDLLCTLEYNVCNKKFSRRNSFAVCDMVIKQGDLFQTTVSSYGSNGEGVAYVGEYTVFVPFTVEGEVVEVRAVYVKKNICYAQLTRVLKPSPKRTAAQCQYYGKCGGCSLQHMSYDEQLKVKKNIVLSNLRKIAGVCLDDAEIVASPEIYGYRNKISLPVGGKRGDVRIGMYRSDSHDIVRCDRCVITGKWCKDLIAIVKRFLDSEGVIPYNQRTFKGEIRHVVARYVDDQLLLTLVFNGETNRNFAPLCDMLKSRFKKWGLFVNINTLKNNVITSDVTHHIAGITSILSKDVNGIVFRLQPDSFFQVNTQCKDLLYARAKNMIREEGTEVLIDCFSGIGLLTCAMCSPDYQTYAVEIVKQASEDADKMKELNGIVNLTNICGDVTEKLPEIMNMVRGKKTALLVDPPRKGLGEKICRTVCDNLPDRIVYISCDNATLARDLVWLLPHYTLKEIILFDLFPHTRHIEVLVCLEKAQN